MGLSWQQGPLSPGALGRFLVPEPLPKRLLYCEPLRRRMRVRFGGVWITDSEDVLLLFEPGHYPMAYFREADVSPAALQRTDHTTRHSDLGLTSWYTVRVSDRSAPRWPGSRPTCPPMQMSYGEGLSSHGAPWMLSTKKTNGHGPCCCSYTTAHK
jgi:hypothetical protein